MRLPGAATKGDVAGAGLLAIMVLPPDVQDALTAFVRNWRKHRPDLSIMLDEDPVLALPQLREECQQAVEKSARSVTSAQAVLREFERLMGRAFEGPPEAPAGLRRRSGGKG